MSLLKFKHKDNQDTIFKHIYTNASSNYCKSPKVKAQNKKMLQLKKNKVKMSHLPLKNRSQKTTFSQPRSQKPHQHPLQISNQETPRKSRKHFDIQKHPNL